MLLTKLLSKAKGHNLLAVGFKSITVSRFLEFGCLIVRAVLCDGSKLALIQWCIDQGFFNNFGSVIFKNGYLSAVLNK
jgi:hypothetical protein